MQISVSLSLFSPSTPKEHYWSPSQAVNPKILRAQCVSECLGVGGAEFTKSCRLQAPPESLFISVPRGWKTPVDGHVRWNLSENDAHVNQAGGAGAVSPVGLMGALHSKDATYILKSE